MFFENAIYPAYNKYCQYMENESKGVELIAYAASGILFAFAYHKIRPVTKFGKPSDIPKHFLQNRLRQKGSVAAIHTGSKRETLLLVNHKPPLDLLFFRRKQLPVKLYGISVNTNGYSWLETIAVNHQIEFRPIASNTETVECQVIMLCPNNKKRRLDLAEALLSLGFGKLTHENKTIEDPILKRYCQYLEFVEKNAKKNRLGFWSQSLPPIFWPLKKLRESIESIILLVLPSERRLPELVR